MRRDINVFVIVLAWNHVNDTIESLESIIQLDFEGINIIVVDNGSTDGTYEKIKNRFPKIILLRSDTNLGISGGYNLGMKYGIKEKADYILIANNDISVDPTMITKLAEYMENNPKTGIAMPKIFHYYGNRKRLWCTGAKWRQFPPRVKMTDVDVIDSNKYSKPFEIEYAPSCCLLIRREAIEKVGYFDTNYFFYNDDWDYSDRMRKMEYSIRYVPSAKMWHKVSVSTQKSEKPGTWWYYYGRSTYRYYRNHHQRYQLYLFSLWFIMRETIKLKLSRITPFIEGIRTESSLYHD